MTRTSRILLAGRASALVAVTLTQRMEMREPASIVSIDDSTASLIALPWFASRVTENPERRIAPPANSQTSDEHDIPKVRGTSMRGGDRRHDEESSW